MRDNNLGSSWSTKRNAFQGTLWLQGYDFLSYDYLSSLLIALDLNSVTFAPEFGDNHPKLQKQIDCFALLIFALVFLETLEEEP